MAMVEGADLILARLEGFLQAFARLNDKTNHGCTFTVYQLPKGANAQAALAAYFKAQPSEFRVTRLTDWEREARQVFSRFLFLFRDPIAGREYGDYLVDPHSSFVLMSEPGRQSLLDDLAAVFHSLAIAAAWRVVPSPNCQDLREWCFQEDLLLELPDRLCLLHLGVSD